MSYEAEIEKIISLMNDHMNITPKRTIPKRTSIKRKFDEMEGIYQMELTDLSRKELADQEELEIQQALKEERRRWESFCHDKLMRKLTPDQDVPTSSSVFYVDVNEEDEDEDKEEYYYDDEDDEDRKYEKELHEFMDYVSPSDEEDEDEAVNKSVNYSNTLVQKNSCKRFKPL